MLHKYTKKIKHIKLSADLKSLYFLPSDQKCKSLITNFNKFFMIENFQSTSQQVQNTHSTLKT